MELFDMAISNNVGGPCRIDSLNPFDQASIINNLLWAIELFTLKEWFVHLSLILPIPTSMIEAGEPNHQKGWMNGCYERSPTKSQ